MASVCLLCLSLLFSHFQLSTGGAIFLSGEEADVVLQRNRRHNTGVFEELLEGNLERECREERCDLEEAREVFENDEMTMEFWALYFDGNQCKSSPCMNQGSCQDMLGNYICICSSEFTGRNCEIAIGRRCDIDNGQCMHFCKTMPHFGAKCSCAKGFKLMSDGMGCQPEVEFPCGITALAMGNAATRMIPFSTQNVSLDNTTTAIPSTAPNTTDFPPPTNASLENELTEEPPEMEYDDLGTAGEDKPEPFKRIVGGRIVIPGKIPWQVALITHPGGVVFCGGSILSKLWVVTAAHCLIESGGAFTVRVGENDLSIWEGYEKDHDVLAQYIHPLYNISVSLYNHDIALLRLKSPISYSKTVRPICIGPKDFTEALVKNASPGTVSGWGRLRFLGSQATVLQKIEVPFTDRTECKLSTSEKITHFMFCAGYKNEAKDACQGDSGGPHTNSIQDTWFLTGIVSWGEECAKEGKYGVYTRVSLYYNWLQHMMGETESELAFDVDDIDP